MRIKPWIVAVWLVCVHLVVAGAALADGYGSYNARGDIVISVNVAGDYVQPSGETGQATFAAQEGVHRALYRQSGQQIGHSYVWIYVNGQPVAAIDPPTAMYNDD